ncbi:hypothetical protein GCM10010124_04790 [Pilimelia terevasa]|uniref:Protein-lysine 6-oxidase n=1 Tax=Pilimelia terevasa TaxID=53372 RepID=A0A8J3FE30_9ACTN|nr:lysyl oxidase family protein [Pilimelia terevasa]GGK15234.1 hypothetical protein GCM10010124_04790 [Pilimelia terevasa]
MTPLIRGLIYASSAVLAVTATFSVAQAAAPADPALRLATFETTTEAELDPETNLAYGDLDMYLINGDKPLELHVRRPAYDKPVEVRVIRDKADGTKDMVLPRNLVTDLNRLPHFFDLAVSNSKGDVVVEQELPLCLNGADTRMGPDAPGANPYPVACKANPFGLSNLWGMPRKWGLMPFFAEDNNVALPLRLGQYTARLSVAENYREIFGIPAEHAAKTIKLRVVRPAKPADPALSPQERRKLALDGPRGEQPGRVRRPVGPEGVPAGGLLPDLRAVPAWDISTDHGTTADGVPDRDLVKFGSTVWADGDAPLYVQGFRNTNEPLMEAYQYFFDAAGKETGYVRVGGMEWDPRPLHLHWHFQDFAGYKLLNRDGSVAVKSAKEAFCIANTDQVDLLGAHAVARPGNLGLRVNECGGETEMEVSQRMDVGWGDTYGPERPDQEFDITDVANGTYQIQVTANPNGSLHEKTQDNNTSLRTVVLGGRPGARTVSVPPVGQVQVSSETRR